MLCAVLWTGKLAYENFIQDEVPATSAGSAVGVPGEWQFEPLGDQPFLQSSYFRFFITLGVMFIGLLCIRVLCEAAIVLLRAANDLHDWKTKGKD